MKKFLLNYFKLLKNSIFPFYKNTDIQNLFKALEINEPKDKEVAMFVGGCVRNFLSSKPIDDIDIATIFSPDQLTNKLKDTNFKVIDTGLEHGSVTIISSKGKYEITTLRKDIKPDGRHTEIEIIDDWKEDSNRRDFTINAIYLNKKGKVYDPQQGVQDLKNKIVKFIGDPESRIEEDFLRILRYVRFSIQYETVIEKSSLQAIKLKINGIKNLSKERILNELFKMIKLKNFHKIFYNKDLLAIFRLIFPELKYANRLKDYHLIEKYIKKSNNLMIGILLLDETSEYEYFLHKYKLTNKLSDNMNILNNGYKNLVENKNFFKNNIKNNLFFYGKENIKTLFIINLLNKKKITNQEIEFINKIEKISIPEFPFSGKSLIKIGIKEGKKIGIILKEAEKYWLNNNFEISNKDLETIIRKYNT